MPGTRTSSPRRACSPSTNSCSDPSSRPRLRLTISRPRRQVIRIVKTIAATASGNQPPCTTLVRLAAKNVTSIAEEDGAAERDPAPRLVPQQPRDGEEQDRVEDERAGHGDAVGRGERGRGAEADHDRDDDREQRAVDRRHVDLADLAPRGVADRQARQEAELHRLLGHAEGAGDHRLRGDHRRDGRQQHHRHLRPVRASAGRTGWRSRCGERRISAPWAR